MSTESKSDRPVSIYFIPLMAAGHMNPLLDMAKLFALRPDTSISVITTPGNVATVQASLHSFPIAIELIVVPFPAHVIHYVPDGKENLSFFSYSQIADFYCAFFALQDPIEQILCSRHPDCIVADYSFHWISDTAIKLNVPRLVFYGHGIFASCVHESLEINKPYEKVSDDSEEFIVPGMPHRIELVRTEVSSAIRIGFQPLRESVDKSYGVLVNSFYELEPEYAELYKSGKRRYYVGPVAMVNEGNDLKETDKYSVEVKEAMAWLDSVEENSIVYACFGSLNEFCNEQLREIALGLERSGRRFIWVVRDSGSEILPEGYEERVKGVGVVIKGWAPQVKILNHKAIGGFITHCGWNSTLESIAAEVPMMTWPVEFDQFLNEKLVVDILRIGVSVRNRERGEKIVKAEKVAGAIGRLLVGGEEEEEMRCRAKNYAAMAKAAVKEGGSSYNDIARLINEVTEWRLRRATAELNGRGF